MISKAVGTVPDVHDPITPEELTHAVDILRKHHGGKRLRFKFIDLQDCPKNEAVDYIGAIKQSLHDVRLPDRRARIYFHVDILGIFQKAIVNLTAGTVDHIEALPDVHGPVDYDEFDQIERLCNSHPQVLAEVEKLKLPKGARVINDPWAYGTDDENERRRLFQCYMYIVLNDDPEANHYSLPAPFSPVFDAITKELVWIDYLPLGDTKNPDDSVQRWDDVPVVEYSSNLLGHETFRKDLKPLHVLQPEGPSFSVTGRKIQWQKWEFTLGWTLREGPVLHNVTYDGRSTFWRLSMSEMTVPYMDPRSPYHRKQAFDLGDSGLGLTSNSLKLGCDCLGHIQYFDGCRITADGTAVTVPNVVCMHEIDDGTLWKHTNFRNGQSTAVRNRQLVIQCTATVANYEYILAYKLDQAANIFFDIKATGIVSTMPIRNGFRVPWGTVVAPGVLAANHQHLFSIRIDPAIDGHNNTVTYEDVIPAYDDTDLANDPFGVAYKVSETRITKPGGYNLDVSAGRTYKIENPSKINKISGKPISYKLHAYPSQMMLMTPRTFSQKRGLFATKPIWVTKYRDNELWAAGEFTNQSKSDKGLGIWSKRDENVENEDVVLWHSFGLTHIPRPEDFPVMPAEHMLIALKPSSFFELNPSNDVPRSTNFGGRSVAVGEEVCNGCCDEIVIGNGHV